ncbi:MAG: hypothetical protein WDA20_07675 [Desulfuromonadales bacterium]|jgi:hypothetical protein
MKKILGCLFWCILFGLLLLGVDQFLLRTPLHAPGLHQVRIFYLDFRQRLLRLPQTEAATPTVRPPAAAPSARKSPDAAPAPPMPKAPPVKPLPPHTTYVYADDDGNLQFVDALTEVPARFRAAATPLQ